MVTTNKTMQILCFTVACLYLTACKTTFEGNLNVHEELTLKTKKGVVKIEAGEKNASLHINSKTDATLEIHKAGKNNNIKANFKIPLKEVPSNGSFKVSASTLKQDYNLEGKMHTDVQDSEVRRDYESCQYRVFAGHECDYDEKGKFHCYNVYEYYSGIKEVEYFIRSTTRDLRFDLIKNSIRSAEFSGTQSESERIYTFVGNCR